MKSKTFETTRSVWVVKIRRKANSFGKLSKKYRRIKINTENFCK